MREQFLSRELDLSSLCKLNEQFITWAEDHYNHRKHSTLGMKPIERYGLDRSRIQFLPPTPYLEELFMAEAKRGVKADNTFSFKAKRYEAPVDLRHKDIDIRFDPVPKGQKTTPTRIPIYYQGQRLGEAKLLDFLANDRPPKK